MANHLLPPSVGQTILASGLAGLSSHWIYFVRGEHHRQAPRLLVLTFTLPVFIATALSQYAKVAAIQSVIQRGIVSVTFLYSLWTSMIIYRIFFHRLRRFPGPFWAKVWKVWHVSKLAPNIDNFRQLDALQKEYEDFVRTGPEEITVFAPEGPQTFLGSSSKCIKSAWYDTPPQPSLQSTRNKVAHDQRRRIWDRGFSAKALRACEDRIISHTEILVRQIASAAGEAINATNEFGAYGYTVMEDLAFGKSASMPRSRQSHSALEVIHEGTRILGVVTPVPWFVVTLASLPRFLLPRKMELSVPDVMSWLIEDLKKPEGLQFDQNWLIGDSKLIIVAGSDTTSATLTYIFFHLAKDPTQISKLRTELSSLDLTSTSEAGFNIKALQDAAHLNGVINEALRLHPPVPSGTLRVTPPEGVMVGITRIPGGVTVLAPNYSLGRREDCYERPLEFIPERGSYSCIGKQLALMELRAVVTMLIRRFDVSFAKGEDGTELLENSKDYFTMCVADLMIVFNPMVKGKEKENGEEG